MTIKQSNHIKALVFSISDNGQGMKKEFLSNLFIPFSMEDGKKQLTLASISRNHQGTGLGLSISKMICS